jgi:hypothetical protein
MPAVSFGFLAIAVISWFLPANSFKMAEPTNPVAPIIAIFIIYKFI